MSRLEELLELKKHLEKNGRQLTGKKSRELNDLLIRSVSENLESNGNIY